MNALQALSKPLQSTLPGLQASNLASALPGVKPVMHSGGLAAGGNLPQTSSQQLPGSLLLGSHALSQASIGTALLASQSGPLQTPLQPLVQVVALLHTVLCLEGDCFLAGSNCKLWTADGGASVSRALDAKANYHNTNKFKCAESINATTFCASASTDFTELGDFYMKNWSKLNPNLFFEEFNDFHVCRTKFSCPGKFA